MRSGSSCSLAYLGLRATTAVDQQRFTARQSIAALRERVVLRRVAVAQGFYGGGLIAAVPLFALVHVDRLDMSLSDVGIIGILTAVATMVAFLAWGAVTDRFGPMVALRIGGTIGSAAVVAYALAPSVPVLWVAAVGLGIASASIDVGHRGHRQWPDDARHARSRDGRLERHHRRARHRGRVPDERARAGGHRRCHGRPAAVRRRRRSSACCSSCART